MPIPSTLHRAYDPAEFEHLAVSSELKELFQHIERYTPETVVLETKLRPFVPEYIPAIGDIDAFLKVGHSSQPRPHCANAVHLSKPESSRLSVLLFISRGVGQGDMCKPAVLTLLKSSVF